MNYYERSLLTERLLSAAERISGLSFCPRTREGNVKSSLPLAFRERFLTLIILLCQEVHELRKEDRRCLPYTLRLTVEELVKRLDRRELLRATKKVLEYDLLESMRGSQGFISEIKHETRSLLRNVTFEGLVNIIAMTLKMLNTLCTAEVPWELRSRRDALERRMKIYGVLLSISFPLFFVLLIIGYFYLSTLLLFLTIALWVVILKDGNLYNDINADIAWLNCRLSDKEIEYIIRGPILEEPLYAHLFRRE